MVFNVIGLWHLPRVLRESRDLREKIRIISQSKPEEIERTQENPILNKLTSGNIYLANGYCAVGEEDKTAATNLD